MIFGHKKNPWMSEVQGKGSCPTTIFLLSPRRYFYCHPLYFTFIHIILLVEEPDSIIRIHFLRKSTFSLR